MKQVAILLSFPKIVPNVICTKGDNSVDKFSNYIVYDTSKHY